MNLSATFSIFKLFRDPSLCLPHSTISNFQQLPIPVSQAFTHHHHPSRRSSRNPDIRAVVIDKDNCFARPGENEVYKPYEDKLQALRNAYPGARLLIVSNSAGSSTADPTDHDASLLEQNTSITVLRHSTKKPGSHASVMKYFLANAESSTVTHPSQVAVVGDRLFTDIMMANMMGAWGIWIRDGVVEDRGLFVRAEKRLADFLLKRGYVPPVPRSPFEE
ncbi:MAG: hypothetical protein M1816_007088 [Peltula sp. TS41687]|nr:MAG: hypothetical protein M1816_007088 [Peltula sp. TS41687]